MRRPLFVAGAMLGVVCIGIISYLNRAFVSSPNGATGTPIITAGQASVDPVPASSDVEPVTADAPATPASPVVTECRAQVLVYHHVQDHFPGEDPVHFSLNVPPAALDRHFELLTREGYAVIPLQDLVSCMEQGSPLPPKAVVLTFDDRWRTQYRHALPRLEKYGFTATFFITTEMNGPACMSWDELRDLEKRGMTVGSHTQTHPLLTNIVQDKVLERELAASKKKLTEELGHPVEHFAYPYGYSDKRVVDKVKAAGYRSARTVASGAVHAKEDLYHVKADQAPEGHAALKVMLERAFHPTK